MEDDPYDTGTHVIGAFQWRYRICHAEKKDTRGDMQVCAGGETKGLENAG